MLPNTPTAIILARYVTHMNTQSPVGMCFASLATYQLTSTYHTSLVRTLFKTVILMHMFEIVVASYVRMELTVSLVL